MRAELQTLTQQAAAVAAERRAQRPPLVPDAAGTVEQEPRARSAVRLSPMRAVAAALVIAVRGRRAPEERAAAVTAKDHAPPPERGQPALRVQVVVAVVVAILNTTGRLAAAVSSSFGTSPPKDNLDERKTQMVAEYPRRYRAPNEHPVGAVHDKI